jgi:CBS domain-containing protein
MKVRRFYRPHAICIEPWDTLGEAATRMCESHVSCLPVVLKGEVAGILTERDLVEAVANGDRPAAAHVADYMSEGPVTVSLDDDSSVAATRMLAIGCRHLPVMDGPNLVGMVSAQDLLLLAARTEAERLVSPQPVLAGSWPEEPPPDVDSE